MKLKTLSTTELEMDLARHYVSPMTTQFDKQGLKAELIKRYKKQEVRNLCDDPIALALFKIISAGVCGDNQE